jgi:hypothetical protein
MRCYPVRDPKNRWENLHMALTAIWNPNGDVGTAAGYWLDEQEVQVLVPVCSRMSSPPTPPERILGPTQHPIQHITSVLFPEGEATKASS